MSFDDLRVQYGSGGLSPDDLLPDPLAQVRAWLAKAAEDGVREPNAMVLATAGADGVPAARTVLLKELDDRGLVFFTNLDSAKSADLRANPAAAVVFSWLPLERQVRVTGSVQQVDDAEADAYFATRPRGAQLGAWASPQSTVIESRQWLADAYDAAEARFAGQDVPRPAGWGGWRLIPATVEFWQGRANRLHDRLRYRRADDIFDAGWVVERLAP